jgi:hypothetical protein
LSAIANGGPFTWKLAYQGASLSELENASTHESNIIAAFAGARLKPLAGAGQATAASQAPSGGPGLQYAQGNGVSAKASTNVYKHSFKYADRVRMRGVQDPVSHNFPYSFDDAVLSTNPILKNNGYKMFQQTGTMNGKNGVFEIGLTKDGIIDHRFFRPIK